MRRPLSSLTSSLTQNRTALSVVMGHKGGPGSELMTTVSAFGHSRDAVFDVLKSPRPHLLFVPCLFVSGATLMDSCDVKLQHGMILKDRSTLTAGNLGSEGASVYHLWLFRAWSIKTLEQD